MNKHSNLTMDQKNYLGQLVDCIQREASLYGEIKNFHNRPMVAFDRLCRDFVANANRKDQLSKKAQDDVESGAIPQANAEMFKNGIYTGLINPNRLSYTAYYE